MKETIEMCNGPSSINDVLSVGKNKPITSTIVKDLADNIVKELAEAALLLTADDGMFCLRQIQEEEEEQEQEEAGEPPVQASAAVGVGEVVSVGGAAGGTTGEEEEEELDADGEPETIGDFVIENRRILVDIFRSYVQHSRHGLKAGTMAKRMAESSRYPGSAFEATDIVKHIRENERGRRDILQESGVMFDKKDRVFLLVSRKRKNSRKRSKP